MKSNVVRICELFNCDRRKGHYCCADCGYRTKREMCKPLSK